MDQGPEIFGSREPLVFIIERKFRTEEKVPDGVFMEDTMDQDTLGMPLEIDPVIRRAIPVKRAALPGDFSEPLLVERIGLARQKMELREQLELEILRQCSHLGGADFIENDLEHAPTNRADGPRKARMEICDDSSGTEK